MPKVPHAFKIKNDSYFNFLGKLVQNHCFHLDLKNGRRYGQGGTYRACDGYILRCMVSYFAFAHAKHFPNGNMGYLCNSLSVAATFLAL